MVILYHEKGLGQRCFPFTIRLMIHTSPCLPLVPPQQITYASTHTAILFNIFASVPRNPKLRTVVPLFYFIYAKNLSLVCVVIATNIPVNRMTTGLRLQNNARNSTGGGKATVRWGFGGNRSRILFSW